MKNILKHFDVLGMEAEDKVTGLSGVVTSLDFDLYGCIQVVLTPKSDNGKTESGTWMDITRLRIGKNRVMDVPFYDNSYISDGKKGAAFKPLK